jgi:hypothetical protein
VENVGVMVGAPVQGKQPRHPGLEEGCTLAQEVRIGRKKKQDGHRIGKSNDPKPRTAISGKSQWQTNKKIDGAFENLQMLQQIVEKPSSPTASLFSLK